MLKGKDRKSKTRKDASSVAVLQDNRNSIGSIKFVGIQARKCMANIITKDFCMWHNKLGHWMTGRNMFCFVQSEEEGRGSLTNIQCIC